MTTFSIRDAAREAGVSKTSILRAIQSGRMSAPRKDDGGYAIDPSELFRVFEPKPLSAGQRDTPEPGRLGQTWIGLRTVSRRRFAGRGTCRGRRPGPRPRGRKPSRY